MKKSVSYALVLMLCVSVQGCAGQTKESETQPSTQMQMELELETLQEAETESETGTEAMETEKAEKAENMQVNTVIGSLVDIDMKQITVLSDNGNEIILPISEAELDFRNGFRVGNLVCVDYTGEILETDNLEADIFVLRAADSSDVRELRVSEPRKETEEESEGESAAENVRESESEADTDARGESESETDTEDGGETESGTDTEDVEETESGTDKDAHGETGSETDTEDSGQGESGTDAEDDGEASTEGSTETGEDVKILRGQIQEIEWNSMTIMDEDKEERTFGIMNVQIYFAKGMAKGTEVVVSYTSEESGEGQKVISVMDAVSFEEKEDE